MERLLSEECIVEKNHSVRLIMLNNGKVFTLSETKGAEEVAFTTLPGGRVEEEDYASSSGFMYAAMGRELNEELDIPLETVASKILPKLTYHSTILLSGFSKPRKPVSEIVFLLNLDNETSALIGLDSPRILEEDTILSTLWVDPEALLTNYRNYRTGEVVGKGEYLFIDDHIPNLLKSLSTCSF